MTQISLIRESNSPTAVVIGGGHPLRTICQLLGLTMVGLKKLPIMKSYITRAISLIPRAKILDRVLIVEIEPPLYFLIEIKNPFYPSNALAFKIIQTVKEKYTEGVSSPSQNFEEALREANETLAKLTEEGQTDWVGNLSAMIALIYEDKINLTSLGTTSCYLIREQNITEITSDQPKEVHPLKTFSHILGGDLNGEDKLILGNKDFFENLSLDYLGQILNKGPIKRATSLAGAVLQKEKVKTASAILLEIKRGLAPGSALAPETIYIEPPKKIVLVWQKTKQIYPFIKRVALKISKISAKIFSWLFRAFKKLANRPLFRNISFKIAGGFNKHKKWILLGSSILLSLVLILGIINSLQQERKGKEIESQRKAIIEAEDKYQKASKVLSEGDKEQAKNLFKEALVLVSGIETKQGKSIFQKINSQLDKLNNIIRLTPSEIFDFGESFKDASVSQIFVIDKVIYAVDNKTNKIYQGKENPNSLPQYSGQFVAGTYQAPENLLILYQDAEGIYEYNLDENKLEKAKVVFEGKWEKAQILGSFYTNIYLLDQKEGQIYKHEKTAAGYSKGIPYVDKTKIDLKKAISISLDGYIYLLFGEGKVLKLMVGKSVSDFSVKGIPEPQPEIKKPLKIFTSNTLTNLYILEENRILELNKSGNYLRMFVLENISGLKDFWVNQGAKKVYLLSETKVYEINL